MSEEHAKHDAGHHGGGHGGHEEEEEGGAPEWLISFADMVMLLMGFFVILFALNVQPKGGNAGGGGEDSEGVAHQPLEIDPEFVESIRRAFRNPLNPENPEDAHILDAIAQRGAGNARDVGIKGAETEVRSPRDIDFFGEGTDVPFERHQLEPSTDADPVVTEFASRHRGRQNVIEVRGHTDEVEAWKDPGKAFRISLERAAKVAERLAEAGIDWGRLRVTAAGITEPRRRDRAMSVQPGENARVELLVRRDSAIR
ncbi:MAG: hypothetical protein CMJ23_14795 [Phycisphaerae bacterium]|nr:hypothetical protein [Phycisphaerae bacterium]